MTAPAATTLASFRDVHRGGAIVVCGCGASLSELARPGDFITIGVNDVGRRFDPDYLVVVNPPEQFTGDRFAWVARSRARHLFTQLPLPVSHPGVVHFRLGTYGGTDCCRDDVLHYTRNSPYVAVCLAGYMGAARIGLIGVDFTEHHFFAATGRHPLASLLPAIDEEYRRLGAALRAHGVEVCNLSRDSRLTAFPSMSVEEFSSFPNRGVLRRAARYSVPMSAPHRCLVIVPSAVPELYAQVVAAFTHDPQVFVLRDRRGGDGAARSVGVFAVGGGAVDPGLQRSVEERLRGLGVAVSSSPGSR